MQADERVMVELTAGERFVLRQGLHQWGGPVTCSEEMAVAMGFGGLADLLAERSRIRDTLDEGGPLSRWDWTRALLATEIVFASYVMGAAWDWSIVSGVDDVTTLRVLRGLQPKLARAGVLVRVGTFPPPDPGQVFP